MSTIGAGTSRIELSRRALERNIGYLRRRIGKRVRLTSVVKGNAYGHGLEVFLPLAEACGVDSFAVFSAQEALRALAVRGPSSAVLIMGAIEDDELEWAIEHDVSFYVFDLHRLRGALRAAERVGRRARIHLELETGLHRTGLETAEQAAAAEILEANPERWTLEGVCTHYAGAESVSNYLRIQSQIGTYRQRLRWFEQQGLAPRFRHTACSAAAITYPETLYDMVRIGIAQYGLWPSVETRMHVLLEGRRAGKQSWVDPLRRVMRWRSSVMALKTIDAGEFVSYGNAYLATSRKRVAVVPVGYAHGFTRALSNLGRVLLRGRRVGVIGMVNMNMMLLDVSELPTVERGDEVVLIGSQGNRNITVASFSEMSRFLNYEMLVRLPAEIPRVVVD